jgi:hypothetical protein
VVFRKIGLVLDFGFCNNLQKQACCKNWMEFLVIIWDFRYIYLNGPT